MTPADNLCPRCGGTLPQDAPKGLCPACLLSFGLNLRDAAAARKTDPDEPTAEGESSRRIGRYKILQKLGEGGGGVVYLAEQAEPVRRRVALKILKLGMDTRQVIARFEAERQALALMDHPNIAKVLDAGATGTGRPYFVMELVKGVRITSYCDENQLSTRERLDLFTQICQAIQHAHQKGIIHRDIKPSNILVTLHDGVPVPKVIDFGIAKATEQPLTEKTLFTAVGQFMGTPAYMSPEQVELSGLDIDTRSDIYALGVLLYELLTGRTPFDAKELLQAGLDEMRRKIREQEPVRPSTRLSTMVGAELTQIAERRRAEPARLAHFVRGDLDWIVMKCLEKDRNRRYETANGLAMDIRRHLAHEPVLAAAPTAAYRLRKLARRHRLLFAAGSAVAAALVFGLALAGWQFTEKGKALDQAKREAAKSEQVARFLRDTFQAAAPSVAKGRDITILKEMLDKTRERVGRELTNQPEAEMEIRRTLAETYQDLDLFPEMETTARAAVELGRKRLGEQHRETAAAEGLVGLALLRQGKLDEAETSFRQSVAGFEHSGRPGEAAIALSQLGYLLLAKGKLEQAEATQQRAVAMMKELWGPDDPRVASALPGLAQALASRGRFREAESILRDALAAQQQRDKDAIGTAHVLVDLANVLIEEHKLDEALMDSRAALAIYRRVAADQPDLIVAALSIVAGVVKSQGRTDEAESLLREALTVKMAQSTNASPELATLLNNLAGVLSDRPEKLAEAETFARQALAMRGILLTAEHPDVAVTMNNLASILYRQGKLEEAQITLQQALDMKRRLVGTKDRDIHRLLNNLGIILREEGKLTEAEEHQRECLSLRRAQLDKDHPQLALVLGELGLVLMLEGGDKLPEAETLLREALEIRERKTPDQWGTFLARSLLGRCLMRLNNLEAAEPLLITGYEGMKQRENLIPVTDKPRLPEAGTRIFQLYDAWGKPEKAAEWRAKLAAPAETPKL